MASCITSQWKTSAPQAKLTVNIKSQTATQAVLEYTLEYIASSAANTSTARAYTIKIGSSTINGSYSIDGKKGTYTVKTGTVTIDKTTAAQTIAFSVSFAFNLTWTGVYKGTLTASSSIAVAAKTSYKVAYNANGGTGAPSAQTKWAGTTLKLSSTKPTKAGHSFQGWATSASGAVVYASGANYTANAAVTLYAVWKANTYTVTYNANGGTLGSVKTQTKTYGQALTLTGTATRQNYNFKGWAASASAATATYTAGASYTANAAITLYAVWELAYTKPIIYNLSATRCNAEGVETESGTYALVKFDWGIDDSVTLSAINVLWASLSDTGSKAITATGKSGNISEIIGGELVADASYTITVEVTDTTNTNKAITALSSIALAFDAVKTEEGIGASVGKPAERAGVFEVALDTEFNNPVSGNVLGLNRLPAIPEGAELNDYMQTGSWAIHSNAIAATITCGGVLLGSNDTVPPARACRFEVNSATGEGIRAEQWSYLRQRLIPYNSSNPTFEREITRNDANLWTYYNWWKSNLTPAAAEKVYSKAAITIALSANNTLGAYNTYTPVPFDTTVIKTSDRLIIEGNYIRIGANISYVKASGQLLIDVGTVAGNRHARIQKISGDTVTSHSWTCVYAPNIGNTLYPFTPIIIPVKEGDFIRMVYYTGDTADAIAAGSLTNGRQTYLTVEEL